MSALASAQLLTFWGAVCLGMKLAAAYALPAALREELHFSWQLESLLDLLYFTAAGLISFLYLLSTVDGTLRWFVLAGEVIGAVLLRLTVYRWLLRLLRWPLRLCCKLLHGVGKLTGALWKLVQKWLPEQPGPGLEDGNFSEESTNSP